MNPEHLIIPLKAYKEGIPFRLSEEELEPLATYTTMTALEANSAEFAAARLPIRVNHLRKHQDSGFVVASMTRLDINLEPIAETETEVIDGFLVNCHKLVVRGVAARQAYLLNYAWDFDDGLARLLTEEPVPAMQHPRHS